MSVSLQEPLTKSLLPSKSFLVGISAACGGFLIFIVYNLEDLLSESCKKLDSEPDAIVTGNYKTFIICLNSVFR